MNLRRLATASLALLLCVPAAAAGDETIKNDSLTDGSSGIVQLGFVINEIGAAVLDADPGDYPITLKELQVFIDKCPSIAGNTMSAQFFVWNTSTIAGSSPSLGSAIYSSPSLTLTSGAFNTWDVTAENLVLTSAFTVGVQVESGTTGLCLEVLQIGNSPNLFTDSNGCQGGKNWVRQTNGVWANLCGFGVSGDLAIRVVADVSSAGVGDFNDLGASLAGNFSPTMTGSGSLVGGGAFTIDVLGLPPFETTTLVVGFFPLFLDFKGGLMGPTVDLTVPFATGLGSLSLPASMPNGVPPGTKLYLQSWTPDAGGPAGFDATNTLELVTP